MSPNWRIHGDAARSSGGSRRNALCASLRSALVSPVCGGVTAGAAAGGGTVAAAPAGVSVAVFGDDIAGADGAVGGLPDCTAPTGAVSGAALALAGGVAVGEVPLAPLTSCDCSGG